MSISYPSFGAKKWRYSRNYAAKGWITVIERNRGQIARAMGKVTSSLCEKSKEAVVKRAKAKVQSLKLR